LSRIILLIVYFALLSSLIEGKRNKLEDEQEIFLSFRYGRSVNSVIIAYEQGEKIFLPVSELFGLLMIYHKVDISNLTVSGYFLEKNNDYLLDLKNGRAIINQKNISFNASNFLIKELDFYLEPWILKELFNLEFTVNASDLILSLVTPDIMPTVKKSNRIKSREFLEKSISEDIILHELKSIERHIIGGGYLDYSSFSNVTSENNNNNLKLSLGGELFFGESEGSVTLAKLGNIMETDFSNLRWRYVFMDVPWLSQLGVGQMSSSGLNSQQYSGMKISNDPVNPPQTFDSYIIDGYAVINGDVELYQYGKLVDYMKSDEKGYYRFEVPLNYGTTDIKIKIFGPSGEIIEDEKRIHIPFNFVKKDQIYYGIEFGKIENAFNSYSDNYFINTNASLGITSDITSKFGVQYFEEDSSSNILFYNSISTRILSSYLANIEWVQNSFSRLSFQGLFSSGKSLSLEYTKFDSTGLLNPTFLNSTLKGNFYLPLLIFSKSNSIRMSMINQKFINNSSKNIGTFDLSTSLKRIRINLGYRETIFDNDYENFGKTGKFSITSVYSLPRHNKIPKLLKGLYIRSNIRYNYPVYSKYPESFSMVLVKEVDRWGKINFSYSYNYEEKNYRLEIGFIYNFEKIRSSSRIRLNNGNASYIQTLRGSIGYDQNLRNIIYDDRHQVGSSGVSVRMFLDENNSGKFENNEKMLIGNALRIKNSSTRGIKIGQMVRFTSLRPYTKYSFYIDESKILNPMLSPTHKEFTFIPDPNQYSILDVPFRITGIIDGKVLIFKNKNKSPIGGLRVKLISQDGEIEKTFKTFSDGSYYAMEIPPGKYQLRIDETQLQFLKAKSSPAVLEFEVKATKAGDFVQGLDFLLTPLGE